MLAHAILTAVTTTERATQLALLFHKADREYDAKAEQESSAAEQRRKFRENPSLTVGSRGSESITPGPLKVLLEQPAVPPVRAVAGKFP